MMRRARPSKPEGGGQGGAGAGDQLVPQLAAGAVQPRLHGLLADLQACRGLGSAKALDVPQHEHRAVDHGERVDRGFQRRAEFAVDNALLGARCGGDKRWHGLMVESNEPAATTQTRERFVSGNVPPAVERDVSGGSGNGSYATSFLLSMAVRSSARIRAASLTASGSGARRTACRTPRRGRSTS
jgi:hypothetical protein